MYGIDDHFFNTYGYVVYKGRRFIESDRTNYRKVVMLDTAAAEILCTCLRMAALEKLGVETA